MMILIALIMLGLVLMIILTAEVMTLPFLSACVTAGVVGILWDTPEPVAAKKKYQVLAPTASSGKMNVASTIKGTVRRSMIQHCRSGFTAANIGFSRPAHHKEMPMNQNLKKFI